MKIKVGLKFKAIEGLSKYKTFTVTQVNDKTVTYRSEETKILYTAERKHFEKFIQKVNKFWSDTNKAYKRNKQELK